MTHVGLLKWFDITKGFGKLESPNIGDVFVHKNNFLFSPKNLRIGSVLIFEIEINSRGLNALKISYPESFEDFKVILTHIERNPIISLGVVIEKKNKWGQLYRSNEHKTCNLIDDALNSLLRSIKSTQLIEYFTKYYEEQAPFLSELATIRYFNFTRKQIHSLPITLNDHLLFEFEALHPQYKNNPPQDLLDQLKRFIEFPVDVNSFLIKILFSYYIKKTNNSTLFLVWQKKEHRTELHLDNSADKINEDDSFYAFPQEMFLENSSKIEILDFKRLFNQPNGHQLGINVANKKIISLEQFNKHEIDDIIKILDHIALIEFPRSLIVQLNDKILRLLNDDISNPLTPEAINSFKQNIDFIKSRDRYIDYERLIEGINNSITDHSKFILWKESKYFNIGIEILHEYSSNLSYSDFLQTSYQFQLDYFIKSLNKIEEINGLSSFGLLTYLAIESPINSIDYYFHNLSNVYQSVFWLNFAKDRNYCTDEIYNKYESIPYTASDFNSFVINSESLQELYISNELVANIKYFFSRTPYKPLDFDYDFDLTQKRSLINGIIETTSDFDNKKVIDLFKHLLYKVEIHELLPLCKAFIPKHINSSIIELDTILKYIYNIRLDSKNFDDICIYISENVNSITRVEMWLDNYIKSININEPIEIFYHIPSDKQPKLFKKIFSFFDKNKAIPTQAQFDKLKSLLLIDTVNIDVKICIRVLDSLKSENNYIGENDLTEIICRHINENELNLVKIKDLFQLCTGRTWITKGETLKKWFIKLENNLYSVKDDSIIIGDCSHEIDKTSKSITIDGEVYPFEWVKINNDFLEKKYEIPVGIIFCDASNSQKDSSLNIPFNWCCNSKCYSPCQSDHNHLEWTEFSLRDFIRILNIQYDYDKYYRFVGLVNRVNRLLDKLKCNSCNKILRDAKTSEFAFYKVTTFHCTNLNCTEYNHSIYLNHCLNIRCLNVVDSRISKTCPHGLIICDTCGDCCSHNMLENRLNNLKTNGIFNKSNPRHIKLQFIVDNKLGHKELNERYDYQSGDKLLT